MQRRIYCNLTALADWTCEDC